jgi:hypothetical protein
MNCGFREGLYLDTFMCINSFDILTEPVLDRRMLNQFFKKYEIEEHCIMDFFCYEILPKSKDYSKEKIIISQELANKFCDYYMGIKMKNCCNCCKCCCQNKCCNKKDDNAIKIDVEKEIESFVAGMRGVYGAGFLVDGVNGEEKRVVINYCKNKIKNIPTIEIYENRFNEELYLDMVLVDYIEDCLTSKHRDFSLDEKIEAIEHLNKFINIRATEWLSDIKNAIR